MERLTYRDKDGFPMMKKRGGFKQGGVERLAAYEDTHMMPSDVTSMRMDMAIIAALFNGVDVDRMKELAEADKEGRLVVLPCQVGTATYYIRYPIAVYPDESEPEIKRGYLYFVRFGSCWALRFSHPRGG